MALIVVGSRAPRYRYARLDITEQLRTTGAAATYAGVAQFTLWARGVGCIPTTAMTSNSDPSPFAASASTEGAGREAYKAFTGALTSGTTGWRATETTGWVEIDMGAPRDVVAFNLGASYDGITFTYPTKWKVTLHNGVVGSGRTIYDNTSGGLAWTNSRLSRTDILAEAAAGRIGGWTSIQNCLYVSATHTLVPRNGFLRVDVPAPQSGTALVTDQMRIYDGSSWIAGNMGAYPQSPLGYQSIGTIENQYSATAWNSAPTTGWYVANTGGLTQTNFLVLPIDPVYVKGLEITCPNTGYTRAPGSFTVSVWNGNGWTQVGSGTPAAWVSARQVQQFTW